MRSLEERIKDIIVQKAKVYLKYCSLM
ncbi:hypothetical protein BOH78_0514 [Pichia kudriavzevii]|uniref:Uncharacterized protein n=1 Tax=Pichia kudriavzevii TaxID=4909 RepID=A0A1V2LVJ1_PICKU|nr:hypothetical protein BOH78_0514 [Pichia kudriavzevii]